MTSPSKHRAHVVGLGLIGSSIAAGLVGRGWTVSGEDVAAGTQRTAEARGLISASDGGSPDVVIIATPAGAAFDAASTALAHSGEATTVTDVCSVKWGLVEQITDPRFVGGHPMAGSAQQGLDGADGEMFRARRWVLCPSSATTLTAVARVHAMTSALGADVTVMSAARHDRLVSVVSHLPHLTAGALVGVLAELTTEDAAAPQLAAQGFADMTRVAGGDAGMWPDVLVANAAFVATALADVESRLHELRVLVERQDRAALEATLVRASTQRRVLDLSSERVTEHVRVMVEDRAHDVLIAACANGEILANLQFAESSAATRELVLTLSSAAHSGAQIRLAAWLPVSDVSPS